MGETSLGTFMARGTSTPEDVYTASERTRALRAAWVAVGGLAAFAAILADTMGPRRLVALDTWALPDPPTWAWWTGAVLSLPGAVPVAAVLLVAAGSLLWRRHLGDRIPWLVVPPVVGYAVARFVKHSVGRVRPDGDPWAFPSGHAEVAATAWVLAAWWLQERPRARRMLPALAVPLLVGVGRVLEGRHWPTDVLGGWALGAAVVGTALWLHARWGQPGDGIDSDGIDSDGGHADGLRPPRSA